MYIYNLSQEKGNFPDDPEIARVARIYESGKVEQHTRWPIKLFTGGVCQIFWLIKKPNIFIQNK